MNKTTVFSHATFLSTELIETVLVTFVGVVFVAFVDKVFVWFIISSHAVTELSTVLFKYILSWYYSHEYVC